MKRLLASLLSVLFGSVIILTTGFAMSMDEEGNMLNCPYMQDSSALCSMTGLEHLAEWKMTFVAQTVAQNLILISGFLSVFLIVLFLIERDLDFERVKLKWRQRKNDVLKTLDSLFEQLRCGTLHPTFYQA